MSVCDAVPPDEGGLRQRLADRLSAIGLDLSDVPALEAAFRRSAALIDRARTLAKAEAVERDCKTEDLRVTADFGKARSERKELQLHLQSLFMGRSLRYFTLWLPVGRLTVANLGLYDDARFEGRCILSLRLHHESLSDLADDVTLSFMRDVRSASLAIQKFTGAERVNVAILGNREPHVHAHLIPRFPLLEEFPNDSPWMDPRPKRLLLKAVRAELIQGLAALLA